MERYLKSHVDNDPVIMHLNLAITMMLIAFEKAFYDNFLCLTESNEPFIHRKIQTNQVEYLNSEAGQDNSCYS